MSQPLNLSRSARLAGVTRGELQKRIRQEGVETFEGKIQVEDLIRLYPEINMDNDPVFERVQRIKREARPKAKYSDGWLPDPEVLMSRLREFQHTLVQTKAALNGAEMLIGDTQQSLQAAIDAPTADLQQEVKRCITKLKKAMGRLDRAEDARATVFAKNALLKIVTASVRLLPSGHEFFVDGNDSILEAGLKAGLHLGYGCSSGNCGDCKCKVVSGAVRKLRDHDYVLSKRESEEGYILACSNTAISDLVLEASEAGQGVTLPQQNIRTRVRSIESAGTDLALLNLQTPHTKSLRFKAGQRVELSAEEGSSLSLFVASCPCDGRNLQFLVPRQGSGEFGELVFNGSIAEQTVLLKGPEGGFVLEEESSRPAIFIAAGNGLAPIKSLVEQAITIDNAEHLMLIQLGANAPGSPLDNLMRSWSHSLDNFDYHALSPDTPVEALLSLINSPEVEPQRSDLYVAGPEQWLQALRDSGRMNGLDDERWHLQATE
ncbi:2Fe-2S iron-sulfur cluster-binding protein [endosymbiont of Riftia pachyptila]|uniref:CDP-6-deoxy-L-threo-D-glycero-4-hexulose-3-dehydrase reductase n=1 Tax=endosymbiont of Riftia pachyptila (vent Ph05) TaxID=1048808 RepID=G2D9U8_9GAMM|nr:2Fe-2S iron-sulfur cluster-binding protein [endosymbiont of Riftia pachyptila]EGV52650.1 CDP-6-deoxy-L-threo-D-glycero-4-hexulose-3-dehydrase reductase [endosymbiont of Riftia pachyptila (vent Ph05)]